MFLTFYIAMGRVGHRLKQNRRKVRYVSILIRKIVFLLLHLLDGMAKVRITEAAFRRDRVLGVSSPNLGRAKARPFFL